MTPVVEFIAEQPLNDISADDRAAGTAFWPANLAA